MAHVDDLRRKFERIKKDMETEVKVALIGQPSAGKSSLINNIVGRKVFEVGVHTDTTVEKQEKKLSEGLTIVDLQGYGTKRFRIEDWLREFRPEQYDLYLFVFDGKLLDADATLFQNLKKWRAEREHPFFIVRNKEDDIYDDDKSLDELKAEITKDVCGKMQDNSQKVYFTCCRKDRGLKGVEELKQDILGADIPKVKKSKLMAEFKASSIKDLDEKRSICLDKLDYYAWAGAAGGLIPIPGVDIAVDIPMIISMFSSFREIFGIENNTKTVLYGIGTAAAQKAIPVAEKLFETATKEGIKILLKQFASKELKKSITKYIPIIGWAISAAAGYNIIKEIGVNYINDCYEVAKADLEYFAKNS